MQQGSLRWRAPLAALAYTVLALFWTWPLVLGLTRDLPWDLGDPVFNCFVLERNARLFLAALGGNVAALGGFWDARIFHPEPLTLAYSEHQVPQALLALPVYALTHNVLLSYNLLFLATFVLSGLGVFLLVRDLTSQTAAAFLAGLLFAFAPYRVEQLSHLQVLSSQWMPFALLGFHRFARSGRWPPLVFGSLALLVQGLSCGYYLLFFSPLAAAFAAFELLRHGRGRAAWARLAAAGALVVALALPFLLPYQELRARGGAPRQRAEIETFSADVFAYLTAPEEIHAWGDIMRTFPASEGQLFPGLVAPLGAALALWVAVPFASISRERQRSPSGVAWLAAIWLLLQTLAVLLILSGVAETIGDAVPWLKMRSLPHALLLASCAAIVLCAVSPALRRWLRALAGSHTGFFAGAAITAVVLSYGPTLRSFGRPMMEGPYTLLYDLVPGFDGLRVPARFAMLVVLCLAVLAGLGAAAVRSRWALAAAAALAVLESTAAPLVVNDVWSDPALRRPPARLAVGAEAPAIYRRAAALPDSAVLIEFPFGSEPYELRYMFHQPVHGLPLVNGFSGAVPASYARARGPLRAVLTEPERASQALAQTTATHAIVHEGAWGIAAKGRRVTRWLEEHGGEVVAREGSDALVALKR